MVISIRCAGHNPREKAFASPFAIRTLLDYTPSVTFGDSSPCTGEPFRHAGRFSPLGTKKLHRAFVLRRFFYFASGGVKSRVRVFMAGQSWVYFTPAESIIRLEARVAGESAYLSDR